MKITYGTRLKDKVCIVTGSSSGFGRAIALGYSLEGALVVCADLQQGARADLNGEQAISTHELIKEKGGKAIFVQTDVSKNDAVENLVYRTVAEFSRVDVVVNNAGISIESGKPSRRIHDTPEEWWDTTMAVNLKSIFLLSKHAIAQMLKQEKNEAGDRGWIINIASIFGLVGGYALRKYVLHRNWQLVNRKASYVASKGGAQNLTRSIALDYAKDGIHCNAICPGFAETALLADAVKIHDKEAIRSKHPLHGLGTAQDIVGAAIFLASAEARWITGVRLPVDGGYTAQ
ncbi:hypothetical protein FAUST_3018 [Fusarium austroamericanum]|uniref:Uncharacterized protein n=1 Tax=Fusarium austroamericanum TaxID=282268 RepID=A0AAN6C5W5_FUSAU|nr:hypothetical protein FAUST_3018 [Fusarium austroamericanum]